MDIEIAVDVMAAADHTDHIVLFSGDGDFRSLVEAVQQKGVRVTVVSTIKSNPPMIADELRRQADHFIELIELNKVLQKMPGDGDGILMNEMSPVIFEDPPVIEGPVAKPKTKPKKEE